jgi:hypothetical protein
VIGIAPKGKESRSADCRESKKVICLDVREYMELHCVYIGSNVYSAPVDRRRGDPALHRHQCFGASSDGAQSMSHFDKPSCIPVVLLLDNSTRCRVTMYPDERLATLVMCSVLNGGYPYRSHLLLDSRGVTSEHCLEEQMIRMIITHVLRFKRHTKWH